MTSMTDEKLKQLRDLLNEFLEFSYPEKGKYHGSSEESDIHSVLYQVEGDIEIGVTKLLEWRKKDEEDERD